MILVDANLLLYAEDSLSEHHCSLCSADTDFAKFPGLKWRNPLADDDR